MALQYYTELPFEELLVLSFELKVREAADAEAADAEYAGDDHDGGVDVD